MGHRVTPRLIRHDPTGLGSLRAAHNRQVEDGWPLPFNSLWAHHLIDYYRFSIGKSPRLLEHFGVRAITGVGACGQTRDLDLLSVENCVHFVTPSARQLFSKPGSE